MSKAIIAVVLTATVLFGCATTTGVQLANSDSDSAAKQFKPPAGKANLYLAMSEGSSSAPAEIFVDGKDAGQVGPGTFLLLALDPGGHTMSAGSNDTSARTDFDLEAGRNYFYTVNVSSTFLTMKASITIVLLEPMGKLMIRQSKRAQGTAQ
ncbi:MAG TPA: hypothetical protein VMW87_13150 [Spirochaetia bacterium]|nr:hypothetical protein [Spirochaetia bacterium]